MDLFRWRGSETIIRTWGSGDCENKSVSNAGGTAIRLASLIGRTFVVMFSFASCMIAFSFWLSFPFLVLSLQHNVFKSKLILASFTSRENSRLKMAYIA